ncbi:MAG: 50S ribosomal protein L22 [Candidatus Asgardarchaeia archaeon]
MPNFKYSIIGLDPETTAKASGRDLRISYKKAVEVCRTIKGMKLIDAEEFLERVIEMKEMVPYRRYFKSGGHHANKLRRWKWHTGGYPVKAAKHILKVLKNVEANAEVKGLDISRVRIIHAAAHKSMKIKKFIPRAFGRSSPYFKQLTHVEIVVEEERE